MTASSMPAVASIIAQGDARSVLACLHRTRDVGWRSRRGRIDVQAVSDATAVSVTDVQAIIKHLCNSGLVAGDGARNDRLRLTETGRDLAYCAREIENADVHAGALLHEFLAPEEIRDACVADIGCGPGAYAMELAGRGARMAVGLDLNPMHVDLSQALAAARHVSRVMFVRGDLLSLPFPSRAFDGIFMRNVLPYVPNQGALREVGRCIREGGWLMIITHGPGYYLRQLWEAALSRNVKRLGIDLAVILNGAMHATTGHQMRYGRKCQVFNTYRRLKSLLVAEGYVIDKSERVRGSGGLAHSWRIKCTNRTPGHDSSFRSRKLVVQHDDTLARAGRKA